jgi:mono/diheme cytochrome c family protein
MRSSEVIDHHSRRTGLPHSRRRLIAVSLLAAALGACGGDGETGARRDIAGAASGENILVEKGCQQCHGIERLGVSAVSAIGPDLSDAATNVVSRYGRDIRSFMDQPSGTMQLVLSQQIVLTPAERDSIARVLTELAGQP